MIPLVETLRTYRRADLRSDLAAGITTAVMLVPQAMAYAMLAGLPAIVGLYASAVPLALYALLGSSRHLAVGPVAMVSLLVASGVGALAPAGSPEYIGYAIVLAGLVGVLQLAMGVLRAGFLVNFLSHPVVSGFTSAAALIIGFSQLTHLLGVELPRSHHIHSVAAAAFAAFDQIDLATVLIGVGSTAMLLALKRWRPRIPRALVAVVVGSVAVWGLGLEIATVGDVPGGFPVPAFPSLELAAVVDLLPIAITIALVAFMESISVAKAFARRDRYDIDANRELVGLGAANLGSALFGGYPVTGGFSRTAVNAQAGAKTSLASLITAVVVAATLVFLTPLFFYLPKAVLAAIIMTAVFGLIDLAEVRHLWRIKRSDLALLLLTFFATLSLGIEIGIATGIGASLLWFVVRSTRPHIAVIGVTPAGRFRNTARDPEARELDGVLIVRMDASFYYGNVSFLKDTLRRLAADRRGLRAVVLDASAINNLDSSADATLRDLAAQYRADGVELILARVKGPVMDVLERSGECDARFAESVAEAVATLSQRTGESIGDKREDLASPPPSGAKFRD